MLALLEGPASKGYLMVADARGITPQQLGLPAPGARAGGAAAGPPPAPPRAFTTLSASLGALAAATHAGLLHAVAREPSPAALALALRALCALCAAAPAERLPTWLLPETISTARSRWRALAPSAQDLPPAELSLLLSAYTACLAEALTTRKAAPGVLRALRAPAEAGAAEAQGGAAGETAAGTAGAELAQELLGHCVSGLAPVRIEALAALRGLLEHYADAVPGALLILLFRFRAAVCLAACLARACSAWSIRRCLWRRFRRSRSGHLDESRMSRHLPCDLCACACRRLAASV